MTGWTWDQVRDQLDLPRVDLLREQWKINPPLAVTMRAAAEAAGVEFGGTRLLSSSNGNDNATGEFNPMAIMAELGQAEMRPYTAPIAGLPLAQTIDPDGE